MKTRSEFYDAYRRGINVEWFRDQARFRTQYEALTELEPHIGDGDGWIVGAEVRHLYDLLTQTDGSAPAGVDVDSIDVAFGAQVSAQGRDPGLTPWTPPEVQIGALPDAADGGDPRLTPELLALRTQPNENDREPTDDDRARLDEFDTLEQILFAEREQVVERAVVAAESDEGVDEARVMADLERIDEAIAGVRQERFDYLAAMARAEEGEPIVWFAGEVRSGWLPQSYVAIQRDAEASGAWRHGVRTADRYATLRQRGSSPAEAIATVTGVTIGDVTGLTRVYQALSGAEAITQRELSTAERVFDGAVGLVSVATLGRLLGPRVGPFINGGGGGGAAGGSVLILQPAGASHGVLVGANGARLALTADETALVAANTVLQMAASGSDGGDDDGGDEREPETTGLRGARTGPRRGGGGSNDARAYDRQITGSDRSVYVRGTEFDGWDPERRVLLDAKLARENRSFYDVTRPGSFTQRVRIPRILAEARRQIRAARGSGARGIEWHFSDRRVANNIRALMRAEGLNIRVVYTARAG